MASITEQVRRRVVRGFAHRGLLDPDDARDTLAREHGGFSLDASVWIAGHDRAGLERLLRYCARPRFAVRFAEYSRQSVGNYQGQLLADSGHYAHRRLHYRNRPVRRILTQIGEPPELRQLALPRGPPAWDDPLVDLVPD